MSVSRAGAGTFTIQWGTWAYSGNVLGEVSNISGPVSGADQNPVSNNGTFDEFSVNYSDSQGKPWLMQLRAYRSEPSAVISFSPLAAVANDHPYAVLTQFPVTPHHFSNNGWYRTFGVAGWMHADSPWLFFDDSLDASILSAASRPISQRQVWMRNRDGHGVIELKIDSSNTTLPAGDVYSHVITFDHGIGKTVSTWGSTLRGIFGRPVTGNQADLSLRIPMLSTDAGAAYYYKDNAALGYEGTLEAAIASAKAAGIPLGVIHFDSWWYLKGGNCEATSDASFASWKNGKEGEWELVADPALFKPLDAGDLEDGFVQKLGPGMAHGRWVDPCSPYRKPIAGGGNSGDNQPVSGNVITDPGIWQRIAGTLMQSGMVIFEQDWLSTKAKAANTFDDEKFLTAMTDAMAKNGIALQLCMPLARHLLATFQNANVHTIRVSSDHFGWKDWDAEMFGSMIVNAAGAWPTVDNFRTAETRNLLLAVLSAGPLPLGDSIGAFVPIPQAIGSDGTILKPDVSMVPTDASFAAEAEAMEKFYGVNGTVASNPGNKAQLILPPLVGHTFSDFGSSKVEYVFAYSRNVNASEPVSFAPQDFGFGGDVYVYDYFGQKGWRQAAGQVISRMVDSQGSYFVMAPIGPSGMAFLGDLTRFVPASKQRVSNFADQGRITATLQFAAGEMVTLSVFAGSAPVVSAEGAAVSAPVLDASTGLYKVSVMPGQSGSATIQFGTGK